MDLTWTSEQHELRAMLRSLFATTPHSAQWSILASTGMLGLTIEESSGGSGASPIDDVILFEEAGRALVAAPLFATTALTAPFLAAADDAAELVAPLIAGQRVYCLAWAGSAGRYGLQMTALGGAFEVEAAGDGYRLSGTRCLVPDLLGAGVAVVLASEHSRGTEAFLVELEGPGVIRRDRNAVDETRPLGDLVLDSAPARLLLRGEVAAETVASSFRRGITLAAAEAIGVAEAVLELSRSHVCTRTQFGRPIGAFQAVGHSLADVYADIEMTRSLALLVACLIEDRSECEIEVAALAVAAGALGVAACETAIQVHGGIGMTWESPLHRYYKHARYLRTLMGSPDAHRALIARHLSSSVS
jgi:alkylation response protein AidB-like acyl-CoA dehydrogenase